MLRRWAAPIVLLVIGVLFHWKLVLTNQYTWLESPDIANLVLPWFQFQASEWHHGHFPMWDPNGWTGQPLFGQGQPGAAYPLNWLLFLFPLTGEPNKGWIRQDALHWYFVLIHYLAALTAYVLCRELGRSRRASIIGACIFSLGGYIAYTDWPQMLNGAIWAPLVFLYLFRAERGYRPLSSSLLSGFFLGVSWLAGHHQMQVFLTIATVVMWVYLVLRNGRMDWSVARLGITSFVIMGLTSAFQTLPMAEYGRQAVRWVGTDEPQGLGEVVPYTQHVQYALKPISLLGIFIPGVEHRSYDAFVGGVALALAILGLVLAWQSRHVRWLAVIALAGILIALGPNSLLHGILYALVPMVDKARVPAAGTLLFSVGLAPLAAFGIDQVHLPSSAIFSRHVAWVLSGFGAILAIASLLFYAAKVPLTITDYRLVIAAFCALLFAAVLTGLRTGNITARAATFAALALVLFELANVTDYWLPNIADKQFNPYLHRLAEHSDLAYFIRGNGPARFTYDDQEIPYNIGDWYGIEGLNAYVASVPASLWQYEVFAAHIQDILGVKYYIGKAPQRPDQKEVFQGSKGLKVFENPNAYPRVWAVHSASSIDLKQAKSTLADPAYDARSRVFLIGEQPPRLASCTADDVWMPVHQANYIRIEATMNCRGMVILTDTWFPGWRATVDGKRAKIERAYGFARGIVVEEGTHTIEMRYRPWSVYIGGALTLFAALIVFVVRRSA